MATENSSQSKCVLITGGTSGIGYELAKCFAEDQHNLLLVARSREELEQKKSELTRQYGIDVQTSAKDLFDPNAPFELYNEVKSRGIEVNVLVNDAGQGQFGKFAEEDLQRLLQLIQLNVASLTALTHLFLKDMVARNEGKILQLASIASQVPGPWQAVYHGTKAYVLSFTEALIVELKDTNVTLTALQPGATGTDFFNKAGMQDSKILDSKLSDPAAVARDGYKALMSGDDKVISGFKNKVMIGAAHLVPEHLVAEQTGKMQAPKEEDKK